MRLKILPLIFLLSYFLFLGIILPDSSEVISELKKDTRVLSSALIAQMQKLPEIRRRISNEIRKVAGLP